MGTNREIPLNPGFDAAVYVRPYPGAPRGGDLGVIRALDDGALIALVDAVGHGLSAYAAAQIARRTLLSSEHDGPAEILGDLHEALKGSVGAAAAVARVRREHFSFAGIGNVAGWYAGQRLMLRDGVLGQRYRSPRVSEHQLVAGQWLVLNTDGVSYGGEALPAGEAATVARWLVERAGKSHDDAAVLAARWLQGAA